ADVSDIGFSRFANAASVCGRSASIVAARRQSPIRSFAGVDFVRTDTVLSLQLDPTTQTRTFPTLDFRASLTQHQFAVAARVLLQRGVSRQSGHSRV
ncbi:hypothetical protein, partial [Ruegeria sp. HKCCD8929]|uniref:hypothetical protein n=1 Tax=Ruegeria sp. HKCCD8929 TaxID=2683006 RepID=UPI001C2C37DB